MTIRSRNSFLILLSSLSLSLALAGCDDESTTAEPVGAAGGKTDAALEECEGEGEEALTCLVEANDARLPDSGMLGLSFDPYRDGATKWCDALAARDSKQPAVQCRVAAERHLHAIVTYYLANPDDRGPAPSLGELDMGVKVENCVEEADVVTCIADDFSKALPDTHKELADAHAQSLILGSHLACVVIAPIGDEAADEGGGEVGGDDGADEGEVGGDDEADEGEVGDAEDDEGEAGGDDDADEGDNADDDGQTSGGDNADDDGQTSGGDDDAGGRNEESIQQQIALCDAQLVLGFAARL